MSTGFKGGCLCGQVQFTSSADPLVAGHCHCTDCRKTSGTGHASNLCVPSAAVTIEGDLSSYARPADSGNIVTRMFCPKCGSPICSHNNAMEGMTFFRASVLDDPEVYQPQMAVYRSRAPSWDHADPNIANFDVMPEGGPEQAIAEASFE